MKGTGVEYNYLNLPERVPFGGEGEVRYTYDAAGNKLVKKVNGTIAENNILLDYPAPAPEGLFLSITEVKSCNKSRKTMYKILPASEPAGRGRR